MTVSEFERERGAAWRVWDLHVHSPASLVQGYGGDTDAVWERFIDELEALPEDIGVIGINDYWFLDGYRRVVAAKEAGRLQNLDAVFPVIEMRLDQFGGADGHLSRVNLHVVFDPQLDPDTIQAQFLQGLQPSVKLSPGRDATAWSGVITREALADYGARIKSTVPDAQLHQYGSDLKEGFNNLNVALADVQQLLEKPYFKGKALIGVGKTEWANIKWSDQSIAAKKNVVNSADFIFTAYKDVTRWSKDVASLRESKVNSRLLDCSDAHHFADSESEMRLGHCQTWMNTTPTLAGLAYALEEFERRVFVGLEPPALGRVRKNPERFISQICVTSDDPDHRLFDYQLPLNFGFVAVVGNKGQGKSALLDCIALAGNSSRNREFAFLTSTRFLSASSRRKAKEYVSEITWSTGRTRRVSLVEDHDRSAPVSVEYLPQAFVERVCSIDPVTGDADEFERELRAVLFTHISEDQRAGEKTFDDLLIQKTRSSEGELGRLRDELRALIRSYSAMAEFRASNIESEVRARLALKDSEVQEARNALDRERLAFQELDSSTHEDAELAELRTRSDEIESERTVLLSRRAEIELLLAGLRQSLTKMQTIIQRADALRADARELSNEAAELMGLSDADFAILVVDNSRYEHWKDEVEQQLRLAEADQVANLDAITVHEGERADVAGQLAAADSARERARQRVIQLEERVGDLVGSANDEESQTGLRALLDRVVRTPEGMEGLRHEIKDKAYQIYKSLVAQLEAVRSLYEPASRFIENAEVVRSAGLRFNADLRVLPSWQEFASRLDGRRNGDFADWLANLPSRVEDTSWNQLSVQLVSALTRLELEQGREGSTYRNPATALRSAISLDDFLFDLFSLSWLEVRFGLTGDGLPLSQLSPGQRGLVLALFYLVVDRRTTPLLLDQPEENLDNATIASKLVPAIHEAAGRRQTIVVTHNANLAVVGDADQVVHCQMSDDHFMLSSGSLAELDVARFALNVLEGTKPAFDNRRHKYEAFPELH